MNRKECLQRKFYKRHRPDPLCGVILIALTGFVAGAAFIGASRPAQETAAAKQEAAPAPDPKGSLLKFLGVAPSPESVDYVLNKTQFQLHTLLTEQRHSKTWNLSDRIAKNTADGLRALFSVDEDIVQKLDVLSAGSPALGQAIAAVEAAIIQKNRIYVYGCGATGRLAKQMESAFWRPFWNSVKTDAKIWGKLRGAIPDDIADRLTGEMTGADRALISSLEGFEDLRLIGRLQLEDHGIKKDDLVICVTEGGETSSVIGAILAAHAHWKDEPAYSPKQSARRLYFIYNNPDEKLAPYERSKSVIDESGITKINLTTGPQAIAGSTRMQATTIETFVLGSVIETAVERVLRRLLAAKDMARLGFGGETAIRARLKAFAPILNEVKDHIPEIAKLTDLEAGTYGAGHFSTYFAEKGLITVFIDSTERSPTFRLFPLDTVDERARKCWIQVWTPAAGLKEAWRSFLGRPFRGLRREIYEQPLAEEVDDPYLRTAALNSLERASDEQQDLYDFSFSENNIKKRGPKKDDLGIAVLVEPEEEDLKKDNSPARRFLDLFLKNGAKAALITASSKPATEIPPNVKAAGCPVIRLSIDSDSDPLGLRQNIALKMLLNAHSTAVMTKLGRIVGNTMTNVSPSNLKLIGRATYLIQSHVNDVLSRPEWVRANGTRPPLSYGEANAVLFDTIAFLKKKSTQAGQTAEVAISIIRILESLKQKRPLTQDEALDVVKNEGLNRYLANVTQPAK